MKSRSNKHNLSRIAGIMGGGVLSVLLSVQLASCNVNDEDKDSLLGDSPQSAASSGIVLSNNSEQSSFASLNSQTEDQSMALISNQEESSSATLLSSVLTQSSIQESSSSIEIFPGDFELGSYSWAFGYSGYKKVVNDKVLSLPMGFLADPQELPPSEECWVINASTQREVQDSLLQWETEWKKVDQWYKDKVESTEKRCQDNPQDMTCMNYFALVCDGGNHYEVKIDGRDYRSLDKCFLNQVKKPDYVTTLEKKTSALLATVQTDGLPSCE